MESPVIVDSQVTYNAWISTQSSIAAEAAKTPEGQGKLLTIRNGCIGCHSLDGTRLTGPTWLGKFGANVKLADGTTVVADDAYLAESILNPKAKEVDGFSPTVMPPFALTEEEISNIIAYLKTLK
jgi:cytochrome c oxidase subunit 2